MVDFPLRDVENGREAHDQRNTYPPYSEVLQHTLKRMYFELKGSFDNDVLATLLLDSDD